MTRRLATMLLAMTLALAAQAQKLEWDVDFNAVVNNREGGTNETPDQTFIFTRITPQVGVSVMDGAHRIMGGVTWYQPLNNELSGFKVVPVAYYQYLSPNASTSVQVGLLPAIEGLPLYLRSDSIRYVQPVVRGIRATYAGERAGEVDAWLDWRQIRTAHKREAFEAGLHYRHALGKGVAARAYVVYNHLAKSKVDNDDQGVNDHAIINPMLQWRNSHFDISAGALLTLDRHRRLDFKWRFSAGFVAIATWQNKRFKVTQNLYAGKRQMPLYDYFGSLLYQGDQYYHNPFYSRTDAAVKIFENHFVNLSAQLTFHATNRCTAFWQQVAVRFNIGSDRQRHHVVKPLF